MTSSLAYLTTRNTSEDYSARGQREAQHKPLPRKPSFQRFGVGRLEPPSGRHATAMTRSEYYKSVRHVRPDNTLPSGDLAMRVGTSQHSATHGLYKKTKCLLDQIFCEPGNPKLDTLGFRSSDNSTVICPACGKIMVARGSQQNKKP